MKVLSLWFAWNSSVLLSVVWTENAVAIAVAVDIVYVAVVGVPEYDRILQWFVRMCRICYTVLRFFSR